MYKNNNIFYFHLRFLVQIFIFSYLDFIYTNVLKSLKNLPNQLYSGWLKIIYSYLSKSYFGDHAERENQRSPVKLNKLRRYITVGTPAIIGF